MRTGWSSLLKRSSSDRTEGMSLIEVAVATSLLALILLGVMFSLSTGFMARRNNTDNMENQFFTRGVMEELQSTAYASLLSFNGTAVASANGKYRASITVNSAGVNLLRIVVTSADVTRPETSFRLVTQVAKLD